MSCVSSYGAALFEQQLTTIVSKDYILCFCPLFVSYRTIVRPLSSFPTTIILTRRHYSHRLSSILSPSHASLLKRARDLYVQLLEEIFCIFHPPSIYF